MDAFWACFLSMGMILVPFSNTLTSEKFPLERFHVSVELSPLVISEGETVNDVISAVVNLQFPSSTVADEL